jgi:hypothetical protein
LLPNTGRSSISFSRCAQCDTLPDNREAAIALREVGYALLWEGGSSSDVDVLCLARSLIRDLVHDWSEDELAASPQVVCEALTKMIGDEYDFDRGDVVEGELS